MKSIRHHKAKILLFTIIFTTASFIKEHKKITIFSIGDSTMADYDVAERSKMNGGENYPLRGWMMMMPAFFKENVTITNGAVSGASSKSFLKNYWPKIECKIKAGDYVFIQFGHNDSAADTLRHTGPRTTFRDNLIFFIVQTRSKGAHPVLFTSIAKRSFDSTTGKLKESHGDYVTVVRELAREMQVPLVDMYKKTFQLVEKLGPEESKKIYLWIKPGLFTKQPEGRQDNTHLNEYGATEFAKLAAQGIKENKLPLAKYLK